MKEEGVARPFHMQDMAGMMEDAQHVQLVEGHLGMVKEYAWGGGIGFHDEGISIITGRLFGNGSFPFI
jgi:hypothetical protein